MPFAIYWKNIFLQGVFLMLDLLKELCLLDGISGDEYAVRDFIIGKIKDCCEYKVDNLGNIICFKKGKKTPDKKIMLDAHLDEVGLIITSITEFFNSCFINIFTLFTSSPTENDTSSSFDNATA